MIGPEPESLPASAFECSVCSDVVENAVSCVKCHNFICAKHLKQLTKCPFCRAEPFVAHEDHSTRRFVEQLPVACPHCKKKVMMGGLEAHQKDCSRRPRSCGVENCQFSTSDIKEGLQHLIDAHGTSIWENFDQLSKSGTEVLLLNDF